MSDKYPPHGALEDRIERLEWALIRLVSLLATKNPFDATEIKATIDRIGASNKEWR